jgi:hypothetical protein
MRTVVMLVDWDWFQTNLDQSVNRIARGFGGVTAINYGYNGAAFLRFEVDSKHNNVGGGWWFRSSNPISMSGDEDMNCASDGPMLKGRA